MPKRKSRGQSSLFASLPQELRQTISSSLATTTIVAVPPPATQVLAGPAPSSPKAGSKRPASDPVPGEETDVVIKRRRPWSAEDEKRGRKHPWDCEGLVARYDRAKGVPLELRKYYAQRHRLFSLYDDLPLLLDHEGWYSVTPERIAIQIAERMRCGTVLDAFCGVGGNSIAFAQTCERVIALDNNPTRLCMARHNALQYGVADRIEFILCDFVSFAQALVRSAKGGKAGAADRPLHGIDSVFLSPPWGGISYLSLKTNPANLSTPTQESSPAVSATPEGTAADADAPDVYPLAALAPLHGKELFSLARAITRDVAYYLPKNADLAECAALAEAGETVEVEEEWMGGKLKAITLLYGALAGQEKATGNP